MEGRREEGGRKTLKPERENDQVSYKGSPILSTTDYLIEAFKGIRVLKDVFKVIKDQNY